MDINTTTKLQVLYFVLEKYLDFSVSSLCINSIQEAPPHLFTQERRVAFEKVENHCNWKIQFDQNT